MRIFIKSFQNKFASFYIINHQHDDITYIHTIAAAQYTALTGCKSQFKEDERAINSNELFVCYTFFLHCCRIRIHQEL